MREKIWRCSFLLYRYHYAQGKISLFFNIFMDKSRVRD